MDLQFKLVMTLAKDINILLCSTADVVYVEMHMRPNLNMNRKPTLNVIDLVTMP